MSKDRNIIWRNPIIPSMTRRMNSHDYHKPAIYLVTVMAEDYTPPLSRILPGNEDNPAAPYPDAVVELTEVGDVMQSVLNRSSEKYKIILRNQVIMPDHIHLLVQTLEVMDDHFGKVVGWLKGRMSGAFYRRFPGSPISKERKSLWKKSYNDKVLYADGQLETFINYIKYNPWRYLIRKAFPEYFYMRWQFEALGKIWHAIGNIFLLTKPIREAIRFRHSYSPQEWEELKDFYISLARRGEVVVSTFIHPEERAITKRCTAAGASLIWLRTDGFPPRSVVKGHKAYMQCAQGKLLMIAPAAYHTAAQNLTRQQCEELNALALHIAHENITPTRI